MKYVINIALLTVGGIAGVLAALGAHNRPEAQLIAGAIGVAIFALALTWWYTESTRSK